MLRLKDFMTRDVATLSPDDTLRDAITMLMELYVTGAPVVSGDEVVGVISVMDIMDFAANAQLAGVGADSDAGEDEADGWPAAEDGRHPSYFTELWDDVPEVQHHEHRDVLEAHTVDEAMTSTVLSLPSSTEVHEAARYMVQKGVHRLLVADDNQLEGLITTTDFLRLIAERRV